MRLPAGQHVLDLLRRHKGLVVRFAATSLARTGLAMASVFLIQEFLVGVLGQQEGLAGSLAQALGASAAPGARRRPAPRLLRGRELAALRQPGGSPADREDRRARPDGAPDPPPAHPLGSVLRSPEPGGFHPGHPPGRLAAAQHRDGLRHARDGERGGARPDGRRDLDQPAARALGIRSAPARLPPDRRDRQSHARALAGRPAQGLRALRRDPPDPARPAHHQGLSGRGDGGPSRRREGPPLLRRADPHDAGEREGGRRAGVARGREPRRGRHHRGPAGDERPARVAGAAGLPDGDPDAAGPA